MKLYDKYNSIAKEILGKSYCEILDDPKKYLKILLEQYNINQIVDISCCLTNMSYDRIVHIINLFLSGKAFWEKLISNWPSYKTTSSSYEWELLSLVHDISYIYESVGFSTRYMSLEDVCNDMGLLPFFSKLNGGAFYSSKTYVDYFKYKREQFGVCDHGIIASILFENKFQNSMKFDKTELSYVIASHNIFVANRNNDNVYKEYGLYELIPDHPKFKCIANKKNKYSFFYKLFCLLDILEPVNAFDCISAEQVYNLLNTIDYEVSEKSFNIIVEYTNQLETIAHRIFDIPIWLKVGLNLISDKKIVIDVG